MCAKPRRAGVRSHSARDGYKVQGLQTVDLSWTGATSNSIDVYRNGVLFVTVPNKSFYLITLMAAVMPPISTNYARRAQVIALINVTVRTGTRPLRIWAA